MSAAKSVTTSLRLLSVLVLATAMLSGCGSSSSGGGGQMTTPPPPPPPPSDPLVLSLQPIADGFEFPVFLTAPPGDMQRQFIVEQTGRIKIIKNGEVLPIPFLDWSFSVRVGEEQGLLGLAFDPDYASNGRFFISYIDLSGNSVIAHLTASADPDAADPASAVPILTIPRSDPYHNGGMLAFGPDGYLYAAFGDGNWGAGAGDPAGNAQNKAALLGSLLRLDVSGGAYDIPADNPFVAEAGSRGEIWAYGLRNPWRFSFDRENGDLYIGDVGHEPPFAREEINVAAGPDAGKGLNFGWNRMQGSQCFNPPSGCDTAGVTLPLIEYAHPAANPSFCSASVTGGYVYRGADITGLAGAYLYSDFCGGWVRSFRYAGGAAIDAQDWDDLMPASPVKNVMSFGEDARGELYLLTMQGEVLRIAQGEVGAAGGTARSADGNASVTVPAGALAQGVAITVEENFAPPPDAVGKAYDFGPDGTTFSSSATITIGYDADALFGIDEDALTLGRYDGNDWAPVPQASLDKTHAQVSGPVSGFSTYAVIVSTEPVGPTHTLTVQLVNLSGDGVVMGGGVGCSSLGEEGPTCVRQIPAGSTITMEAHPYAEPQPAATWTGCDSVNGFFCTLQMNADRTVTVRW